MQAGKLRHKIEVLAQKKIIDIEGGGTVTRFEVQFSTFAAIEPLSVKDFIASGALQSQISARIILRYKPSLKIKAGYRIKSSLGLFEVLGILADKKSGFEYATLMVFEVLNGE